MATFDEDNAVLAMDKAEEKASNKLQKDVNNITAWTNSWRIKLNEGKSTLIAFLIGNNAKYLPVAVDRITVECKNNKFFEMTLDVKIK